MSSDRKKERRLAAFHEAGHVVMALSCGLRFKRVFVDLNHTQFVGFVEGADDRRAGSYTHALVDAAGPVADMLALRGRRADLGEIATAINLKHSHSSPFYYDLLYAKQNARAAGIVNDLTGLRTQQRQFRKFLLDVAEVVRTLWPLINRLARALLANGSLTYSECKEVLFPRRSRGVRIVRTSPARRELILQLAA
ncbi:MAG: hypothetical protein U1E67_17860 [Hyphomicrobiales bacterium]